MDGKTFIRWVGACAAGEALGLSLSGVIAALVGVLASPEIGSPDPLLLRGAMVAAGFVEGACIGAAQVSILRHLFGDVSVPKFILMSGAGMALGWALGSYLISGTESFNNPDLGTMLFAALVSGLGLGVVLGAMQTWALGRVAGARRWVAGNAVGWSLAMMISFFGTNAMPAGAYGPGALGVLLVTGAAMGAVVGVSTAVLALASLRRD
ncbi:MAG: hypothetical protein JRH11_14450 [Deltaproteobacteria bacterium]|nr:hypothetical protein [Deltaproteobacteria bacterium]